jgi:hypothetical protein
MSHGYEHKPTRSAPVSELWESYFSAKKALGESARLAAGRTFYLPEHGFYHGNAPLAVRIALFFYFEQADVGAVAFMTLASGDNQIARFQIKDALLGGNPTKN